MNIEQEIVQRMYSQDKFSQWLGISFLEQRDGYLRIQMQVRPEMCNGFDIIHGGIIYSLADSALAFASNASGRHAVSIEASISHLKSVFSGQIISATATRIKEGKNIAVFRVSVTGPDNGLIADFRGTVFRKDISWNDADA